MRLVQIRHPENLRRVALVDGEQLHLLHPFKSSYELVMDAINKGLELKQLIDESKSNEFLSYEEIYMGKSEWRLLPSFDHPFDVFHCLLSGTGLTHKASAKDRNNMHGQTNTELTDSMKIYLWGEEGGKPPAGTIGVQPEWFYKGNGSNLKAHGESLHIPMHGEDGGEEPEIAGVYVIDKDQIPVRIGFTTANEFSDHVMEKRNYLYLAPSKLRECSIGPELVLESDFSDISGTVTIKRDNENIWSKKIKTGEKNITHSLENLEHHHFKYHQHRLPGSVHIHFFGADGLSFGEGIRLRDKDQMIIEWEGFGKPLINKLSHVKSDAKITRVKKI